MFIKNFLFLNHSRFSSDHLLIPTKTEASIAVKGVPSGNVPAGITAMLSALD
jgi:hypothetical protein